MGYSSSHLQAEEDNDRFPPRFKLKMVNKYYTSSEKNLLYKYYIYVKSKRVEKMLTLNISGFGHPFPNKGQYVVKCCNVVNLPIMYLYACTYTVRIYIRSIIYVHTYHYKSYNIYNRQSASA